jgi:hypothetical protein
VKLVTLEHGAQTRIGALHDGQQIVDLHSACALYLRDVESESIFYRMADAQVPPNMRALLRGGDTSLEAAHKAFDYVTHWGADATGPRGERLIYSLADIRLGAPIIPQKFFHTAGNFREHREEATKAGFSHPVMP